VRRNRFRTNYPPEIVSLIQTRALPVRTIIIRPMQKAPSRGPFGSEEAFLGYSRTLPMDTAPNIRVARRSSALHRGD
jgi:hypothetical protein